MTGLVRIDKLVFSRTPYAVKADTFTIGPATEPHGGRGTLYARGTVHAAWFRRKDRVTAACLGTIGDYQQPPPIDLYDFLARWDGRYGGDCQGRWDGKGYWGSEDPAARDAHMAFLVPMLEAFPAVPEGYDGWWSKP